MNWRWLPWLLVVGVWTWALLLPNPGDWARDLILPDEVAATGDHPVRQQLLAIVVSFHFSKVLHVLGYAVLAAMSGWLGVSGHWRWGVLAFLAAHAVGTELLQNLSPARHPSWRDVGLDFLGIALGFALTWKWWIYPTPAGLMGKRSDRP